MTAGAYGAAYGVKRHVSDALMPSPDVKLPVGAIHKTVRQIVYRIGHIRQGDRYTSTPGFVTLIYGDRSGRDTNDKPLFAACSNGK